MIHPTLFDPIQIGDLNLPNRIIMAPLTRARAGTERLPNALMADYYRQRAGAGLILSEATSVTPMGVGYADTPGIWSPEQVEGWKQITQAVHSAGGHIVLQLWHVGRISDPIFLNGALPVAPVEVHGANGYLLDQFLQDKTNHRSDAYGGSIENRARLLLEVTDAVISVWGPGQVGMHLAPRGDTQDMGDSNPLATFGYVARELGRREIAFLCVRESLGANRIGPQLKTAFGGVYISNEKFTQESAAELLAKGEADAVAFGTLFIANPDLPVRFALNASLNEPDFSTFFSSGAKGYTDYPSLNTTQNPVAACCH